MDIDELENERRAELVETLARLVNVDETALQRARALVRTRYDDVDLPPVAPPTWCLVIELRQIMAVIASMREELLAAYQEQQKTEGGTA